MPDSTTAPALATSGPNAPTPTRLELCAGTYGALQMPGAVYVFGNGLHFTGGYQVFFQMTSLSVYPPQFQLFHIKPVGQVTPVVTPFTAVTNFNAGQPANTPRRWSGASAAGRHASDPPRSHTPRRGADTRDGGGCTSHPRATAGPAWAVSAAL